MLPVLQKSLPEVNFELYFYDTKVLYPNLEEAGGRHFQAWWLKVSNITHKILDNFMTKNEKVLYPCGNHTVQFISES